MIVAAVSLKKIIHFTMTLIVSANGSNTDILLSVSKM